MFIVHCIVHCIVYCFGLMFIVLLIVLFMLLFLVSCFKYCLLFFYCSFHWSVDILCVLLQNCVYFYSLLDWGDSQMLSERKNRILSNVASFLGVFTNAKAGSQQKPTSALRVWIMTTGDEAGRSFWAQRNNGQVTRILAGGHRGAPRDRRKAGRCDSSTAESPSQPGRGRGTGGDRGRERTGGARVAGPPL